MCMSNEQNRIFSPLVWISTVTPLCHEINLVNQISEELPTAHDNNNAYLPFLKIIEHI